jgi:hypothetical protein
MAARTGDLFREMMPVFFWLFLFCLRSACVLRFFLFSGHGLIFRRGLLSFVFGFVCFPFLPPCVYLILKGVVINKILLFLKKKNV